MVQSINEEIILFYGFLFVLVFDFYGDNIIWAVHFIIKVEIFNSLFIIFERKI